ncbi:MAG TPA: hypothetical protein VK548_10420 [Candidatus Acidoferrum sp.]|nr:hypothetical protein [Candidatus Acidoferrum sp.]
MLKFAAERFVGISAHLAHVAATSVHDEARAGDALTPDDREYILKDLEFIREQCAGLPLEKVVLHVNRVVRIVKGEDCSYQQVAEYHRSLVERFTDEFSSVYCLALSADESSLYTNPAPFGAEIIGRLPEAAADIDESTKCLAVGRYTACVYHAMRVMEIGLNAVCVELGVPIYLPSWDAKLKKVDTALEGLAQQQGTLPRKRWGFFREVNVNWRSVQTAWRNQTMHIEKTYTQERAKEIHDAVKGFMRHLVGGLKARRKRKS